MTFDHALDIKWEPLFTQQLYAVVEREHPLATRDLVGFDELAEQPFVALNCDHTLRRIFDDACARHGVTPTIALEGTDITTPSAASFRDSALAWRRTRRARHDIAQPVQRAHGSNARTKPR
jgi:DNA-binding transcriptional LysR family regulator